MNIKKGTAQIATVAGADKSGCKISVIRDLYEKVIRWGSRLISEQWDKSHQKISDCNIIIEIEDGKKQFCANRFLRYRWIVYTVTVPVIVYEDG